MRRVLFSITILTLLLMMGCYNNESTAMIKYVDYDDVTNEYKEIFKDAIKINIEKVECSYVDYSIDCVGIVEEKSLKVYLNNNQITKSTSITDLEDNTEYCLRVEAYVKESENSNTYYEMNYSLTFITKELEKKSEYINYNELTSENKVRFKDSIKINIDEIDYDYIKYSLSYSNDIVDTKSVKLYLDDILISDQTSNTIDKLNSNTKYTFKAEAFIKESIESNIFYQMIYTKEFTTKSYEKPIYEIMIDDVSYYDVAFSINEITNNTHSSIVNYELYESDNLIGRTNECKFNDLEINTVYTIVLTYQYDLLDGKGLITETVIKEFKTFEEYPFEYVLLNEVYRLSLSDENNYSSNIFFEEKLYQSKEIEIISIVNGISKIIIPDSIIIDNIEYPVTKIKNGILNNNDDLKIIEIGKNIDNFFYDIEYDRSIWPYVRFTDTLNKVFYNCPNLYLIEIADDNPTYMSDEFGMYSKDRTIIYKYYETNDIKQVFLPEEVLYVNAYCYSNNQYVKEYTKNNLTTKIMELSGAFSGCVNLEKYIALNASMNEIIYDEAFKDCVSLKEFDFTNVTVILTKSFENCISLKKIRINSLYMILTEAFAGCISLEEVIMIPDIKQNRIGLSKEIFKGCENLTRVYIKGNFFNISDSIVSSFTGAHNAIIYTDVIEVNKSWNLPENFDMRRIVLNYSLEQFINELT